MKLSKKNISFLFITFINFISFSQSVIPAADIVTVRKGETFVKSITIQSGNADHYWNVVNIVGANSNTINVNPRNGFLRKYQSVSIPVTGINNFNSNFSQGYTVIISLRDAKTNYIRTFHYNLTVNYYVGCESNITITRDVNSNQTDNRSTSVSITAKNNIKNGANARYDAGQKVYLKPGFKVASGGAFSAIIKGCSITNNKTLTLNNTILKEELLVTSNEKQTLADNIVIYPNPFQNQFNLKTNQKIKHWIIYNMLNKDVLNGTTSTINTSSLPKGLYNIQIISNSGETIRKKIVKN
ncbi:3-coathanger stack domain-containing protein [uncultured Tenacibaculum sp.]|uniref:3-coathanger stack domain-containing protein n=1 Tax=uncultured Tenacibaculum sp. TaxID=174713 RepID=UPI00263268A1|nr:3-coathanger stack domain-containing protein [uncultured Tenacibaculum sp.]